MEIWLTEGMFGEKTENIFCCSDKDAADLVLGVCDEWKKSADKSKYKVEKYSRFVFKENDEVAIDFGDYRYFLLITGKDACKAVNKALYGKKK